MYTSGLYWGFNGIYPHDRGHEGGESAMGKRFYEFYSPVKIISGEKALDHLPFELSTAHARRPMVVSDQGVVKAGLLETAQKAWTGSEMIIGAFYDRVPADSSVAVVEEIAEIYRRNSCDSLIAVGGGSVIDTAKGVNILVTLGGSRLADYAGAGTLPGPLSPLITVPTTAGTGSEATLVAVISDEQAGRKLLFVSYFLMPDAAVLDPRMTVTLPPHLTAATGMDALTHAVEAYINLGKNPLSDAYAAAAVERIAGNLPHALNKPRNKHYRIALAEGAAMAGISFSNSMVGIVHTIGHSVGSVCHVPHGVAMNVLLPYGLEFNLEKGEEKVALSMGRLLLHFAGPDVYAETPEERRPAAFIDAIRTFQKELYKKTKLPRSLAETGKVGEKDLEKIADVSLGDASGIYNPAEMSRNEILDVLRAAM